MYFDDVREVYNDLKAEVELVLAYCDETELENLTWDDLLETAKLRDELAAEELEAQFNG